jgi:hypothetical protein
MDNEANIRLDWSTGKDAYLTRSRHVLGAERLEKACQRAFFQWQIDSNADRAFLVVLHNQNDSVIKARIANCRRRDQKLTRK